jgi:hypothetical protein
VCGAAAGGEAGDAPKVIVVDIPPGEDVLDPALARVKQRVGEVCFLRLLSPEDAMEVYFEVGVPLNVTLEVVCAEDELEAWLSPRGTGRRGIVGTIQLDGETLCNFTLPNITHALRRRTFTVQFQVVQWYETNIVLHSHMPLTDPQHLLANSGEIEVVFASLSRTLALRGTKHILTVISWFGAAKEVSLH